MKHICLALSLAACALICTGCEEVSANEEDHRQNMQTQLANASPGDLVEMHDGKVYKVYIDPTGSISLFSGPDDKFEVRTTSDGECNFCMDIKLVIGPEDTTQDESYVNLAVRFAEQS